MKLRYGLIALSILLFGVVVTVYKLKRTANDSLLYSISYANDQSLKITLSFTPKQSKVPIELPSRFAENSELFRNITDIKVANGSLEATADPSIYIISHQSGDKLVISYRVRQGWNGRDIALNSQFHMPILQPNYFQFNGNGVFIYPDIFPEHSPVAIQLNWSLPHGWQFADSFGINQLHQKINVSADDFLNSLFLAGDYQFYQLKSEGGTIVSAIKGRWPFKPNQINTLLSTIYLHERKFWNQSNFKYFLVSLIPTHTKGSYITGYGMTNAFAWSASYDMYSDDKKYIFFLLAHEIFHTWNRPDLFDCHNGNEINYYWFSEGFTNYFANLLNLQTGLISVPEYIAQYNEVLVNYYCSPVRLFTREQLQKSFWKNMDAKLLPYYQGEILAHNWNALFKSKCNSSLSCFMKDIVNTHSNNNQKLSIETLDKWAQKRGAVGFAANIHHLQSGKMIIPEPDSLGPCVKMTVKKMAPYQIGFNVKDSKKSGVISGVKIGSQAYLAGLRNGQQLISLEHNPKDIQQLTIIKIKENTKLRTIKYHPYSGTLRDIPQFALDKAAWDKNQRLCSSWFQD